jgi:hypothetical protein
MSFLPTLNMCNKASLPTQPRAAVATRSLFTQPQAISSDRPQTVTPHRRTEPARIPTHFPPIAEHAPKSIILGTYAVSDSPATVSTSSLTPVPEEREKEVLSQLISRQEAAIDTF